MARMSSRVRARSRQMKSSPPATLWTVLTCQGERLHRRGEGEAALEQNFIENVIGRAVLADVIDVQLELANCNERRRSWGTSAFQGLKLDSASLKTLKPRSGWAV